MTPYSCPPTLPQVRLNYRLAVIIVQRLVTSALPIPLGPLSRKSSTCLWNSSLLYAQQKDFCSLLASVGQHMATAMAAIERDAWFHAVGTTCLAALTAMMDAVLRNKCIDTDGPVSAAMRGGFGVDAAIYTQQAQPFPVFSAPLLAARASVLEYFHELSASGLPGQQQAVWSWEHHQYTMKTSNEGANIKFVKAVANNLSLSQGSIELAYSIETSLPKQLFPEFEQYRDMCLLLKWALCPHEWNYPTDPVQADAFDAIPMYKVYNGVLYPQVRCTSCG